MFHNGEIINDTYQIMNEIGEGGAGIIYLAYHVRLKQKVVIKKIKEKYIDRINVRKEADILKQLKHAYLPKVLDFFQMDDAVYTVIDYIEGKDMSFYIKRGMLFKEDQMLKWAGQLCEVLDYLHTRPDPIIHCDIKPTNIMVQKDGNICLIDFNISIGSYSGEQISGLSRHYSSPEQLKKSQIYRQGGDYKSIPLDARTDIYSLGASFYHMLSGKFPERTSGDFKQLQQMHLPYSKRFLKIIDKAMEINPPERYQTAGEMLHALKSIQHDERELKKSKALRNFFYVLGSLLVLSGAISVFFGCKEINREHFFKEYHSIVDNKTESEISNTLADQCLNVLNNKKYAVVLDKEKQEKADLLYIVADQFFKKENYQESIPYYEEALEYNNNNPDYYRDYAIALARNNELEDAQKQLNIAIENNLSQDDIYLVQAEIFMAQNEMEQAIQSFQPVIEHSDDSYLVSRASILCARAYRKSGKYEDAIELLKNAQEDVESQYISGIWREIGGTCLEYLKKNPEATNRNEWISIAISSYQNLIDNHAGTFENYMNLVILKEYTNDDAAAMSQLKEMESLFPDDYRVYMREALLEMVIQDGVSQTDRDYTLAYQLYKKADQLYQNEKNSGKSDENMQLLETKIKELHAKGWLEGDEN